MLSVAVVVSMETQHKEEALLSEQRMYCSIQVVSNLLRTYEEVTDFTSSPKMLFLAEVIRVMQRLSLAQFSSKTEQIRPRVQNCSQFI